MNDGKCVPGKIAHTSLRARHLYRIRVKNLRKAVDNGAYAALQALRDHDYPAADCSDIREPAWWPALPGGSTPGRWVAPYTPPKGTATVADGIDLREWVTLEQAARRLQVAVETIEKHYLPWLRLASRRQVAFMPGLSDPTERIPVPRSNDVYVLERTESYRYEYKVPESPLTDNDVYDSDWVKDTDLRLYDGNTGRPVSEGDAYEDVESDGEHELRVFNPRGYDPGLEPAKRHREPDEPLLIDWQALRRLHRGRQGVANMGREPNRHKDRGKGGRFRKEA